MDGLLLAVAAATLVGFGVMLARGRRQPKAMQTVALRFGSDVTSGAVEAALAGIAGLPTGTQVTLDLRGDAEGIEYLLHAPSATIDTVRSHLRGVLPSARLDAVEDREQTEFIYGVRLGWRDRHPLLQKGAAAETAAALLGSLGAPLGSEEVVMLRWRLAPARGPHLPVDAGKRSRTKPRLLEALWPSARPLPPEHVGALRGKYSGPVLHGTPTVLVKAGHRDRAAHLASRITTIIRSRAGARGSLRIARLSARHLAAEPGRVGLRRGNRYSPAELAPLIGWPMNAPQIAGLALGAAPVLVPSPRIPSKGRVFGTSNAPGLEGRRLAQPVEGSWSHSLVLGPTGTGKSVLITSLATQEAHSGRGLVLLDMKGDTATDVLARLPERRAKDVIVLEPASGMAVPGLRVFGDGDPELVADLLLGTFRGLFKDSWGVRSDQYLRMGFVTLAHDREATLADLVHLFNDPAYRQRLVGRLDDPMLQAAWAAYEAMTPAEQAAHLASPLRKIHEVVGRKVVRAVLAQPRPRFDMAEVLRRGKIVIVSLPPGRLGTPAVQLLGALVTYELYSAVLGRQAIPEAKRRPFGFYLDEPKVLAALPIPLDAMFELFRGMHCGVTLSSQSITQLPRAVKEAALTNALTVVAFRQSRSDAELLARELPGVSAEGLQHLGRFEVAVRLGLGNGDPAPLATARTLPPREPTSDPDAIRSLSAERYGVDPGEVDRALRLRHGLEDQPESTVAGGEVPVGRRRRAR